MKRRTRPVVPVDVTGVPAELKIGRCVEVWGTVERGDLPSDMVAFRRWGDARAWWLAQHGIDGRDYARQPAWCKSVGGTWSFDRMRREDPARLADRLQRAGLPADWTPHPAPAVWETRSPRSLPTRPVDATR